MPSIFGFPIVETVIASDDPAVVLGRFELDPLSELFANAKVGDKVTITLIGRKREYIVTSINPLVFEAVGEWRDA